MIGINDRYYDTGVFLEYAFKWSPGDEPMQFAPGTGYDGYISIFGLQEAFKKIREDAEEKWGA